MNVLKMLGRVVAILAMAVLMTFGSFVMEFSMRDVMNREGIERC